MFAISQAPQLVVGKRHASCTEYLIGINVEKSHASGIPNLKYFTDDLNFQIDQHESLHLPLVVLSRCEFFGPRPQTYFAHWP